MIHRSPRRTRPATVPGAARPGAFRAGVGEESEASVAARPVSPMPLAFEAGVEAGVVAGAGVGGRG
ncbi:hypothetical protein [Streptosporangium sp. NPDC002524]|uniref:hypothetical protein n=1 Tax=Streptosporangium sp. NPDC002524 TaxID=3154537 RepID=UPI003332A229